METLILALLATPLVFSLVMAFLPKNTSYNVFAGLNLVSVAAVLVLSIMTAGDVLMSGETASALGLWFHLDSLGAIFVLLIGFIGFLTGLFSLPYVKADIEEGSMPAERAKNKTALEASWKYAMVCTAGVAFGLFGTLLIYANAADVIPNAHEAAFLSCVLPYADQFDPTLMRLAFAFIVIGFGTKAGLFPMHTWLPDAHSQAPSPVSALLSGVLLKCAMLVIMRFYGFTIQAVGAEYPQLLLLIVGTLSILVAALSMFRQDDLKRRFAYSSVENVGVIALCLGIGGPLGIAAALLHCVFHGFTKTLAFCVSGNIQHAFGTRSLAKIQGVVEVAPATAALAILALLGLAAFPPFGMFISEFLTFVAGVTAGPMWLVVVVALGLTVAISALTRIALKSVFGHAPQGMGKHEAPALMLIPEIILAVMILWFGIATPLPLVHGVETATGIVLEQSTEELHATPMYRAVFGTETAQSEVE